MNNFLLIIFALGYFQISLSATIAKFYPIRLQRQGIQDGLTEEYLLDINNKYLHLVVKADEYLNKPLKYSLGGDEIKEYHFDYKCYKKGYVKNTENSNVFINDCNGIRGIINFDNNTFVVNPTSKDGNNYRKSGEEIKNLEKAEHILENFKQTENNLKCGVIHPDSHTIDRQINFQDPHESIDPDSRTVTRLVEISSIIPMETYEFFGSSTDTVMDIVMQSTYFLNYFFNLFNLVPVNMFVQIYTTSNPSGPITPASFPTGERLLNEVENFRRGFLSNNRQKHDVTMLYTHENFGTEHAYLVGTICNDALSVGYAKLIEPVTDSAFLAHIFGHLFGFEHTDMRGPECVCDSVCVMDSEPSGLNYDEHSWSNCEKNEMKNVIKNTCFASISGETPLDPVYCGNRIVDEGEDCDCGFASSCERTEEINCCDPVTCRFYPEAICSKGVCCLDCQAAPFNTSCELSAQECAFAGCDGETMDCNIIGIKALGSECGENDHCHDGKCLKYGSMCQQVFGNGVAVESCFHDFNSRGNEEGNCGVLNLETNEYVKCLTEEDELCGKIVCVTDIYFTVSDKYNYSINEKKCGVFFNNKIDDYRSTMVPDGTPCGEGKMCAFNRCLPTEEAILRVLRSKCGFYSSVDNLGNCVCEEGFDLVEDSGCFLPVRSQVSLIILLAAYGVVSVAAYVGMIAFAAIGMKA